MGSYDPQQIYAEIQRLESGDGKLRALRFACNEAEREKDIPSALDFHLALIKESVFSGDRYQALVDFPQYLAILEENPEYKDMYNYNTLWLYKWLIEAVTEFWQISKEQAYKWFSAFRDECTSAGYSLNAYYDKKAIFDSFCSRAKLRRDYEGFKNTAIDEMSDGKANFWDMSVRWELYLGNFDNAMKYAREIFIKRMATNEIPAKTYGYLLEYHTEHKEYDKAEKYARLMLPYCDGQRFRLEQSGLLLEFYSQTDIKRGLEYYERQKNIRNGSKNPYLCFCFDLGTAKLMSAAEKKGMSYKDIDLGKNAETAKKSCLELAGKFDRRNGSDHFASRCEEI